MSLTVEQLREKIAMVSKDLTDLRGLGSDMKASALTEYLEFLKTELAEMERDAGQQKTQKLGR
jgi:hypothetical protein